MSFLRMQESVIIRINTLFAEIPAFAGMTNFVNMYIIFAILISFLQQFLLIKVLIEVQPFWLFQLYHQY
jgi:hypothetical protein